MMSPIKSERSKGIKVDGPSIFSKANGLKPFHLYKIKRSTQSGWSLRFKLGGKLLK